jgi:hypothetical protein
LTSSRQRVPRVRGATLLVTTAFALMGLGVASVPAFGFTSVYGEGTYGGFKGPKFGPVDVVRTQSEGRTGHWCMNTYLGNGGETDPGMGTHCQLKGKNTQNYTGEFPPNQATSQTWVDESASGFLWAWVEWG